MHNVLIAGVGMTKFGKFLQRDIRSLAEEAVQEALTDANTQAKDVGLVVSANAIAGVITGQEMIRGQVALSDTQLMGLPMINVENACASASSAVHFAWLAVGSGQYDVAVALGVEKMSSEDKHKTFAALATAADITRLEQYRQELLGSSGQADSFFMDVYADETKHYMERSGATQRDFAHIAVKNHHHGALNPKAQYREEVSLEEVLQSRLISWPLTLLMCSPIADGAAAVVVCSEDYARRIGADTVRIRASALVSGQPGSGHEPPEVRASRQAYAQAGLGPENINIVELHDAAAPNELIVYEDLGLCGHGEGPRFLASGATVLGGRLPVNTSGGLLSKGHPVGATGCAQLVELTEQLRGRAGVRQAEGVQVALAENAGGYVHPGPAACVVTILSRN